VANVAFVKTKTAATPTARSATANRAKIHRVKAQTTVGTPETPAENDTSSITH
jgi:hypothetical protein